MSIREKLKEYEDLCLEYNDCNECPIYEASTCEYSRLKKQLLEEKKAEDKEK